MAGYLSPPDNAPSLAGKVGDVLTGVLFNIGSYAKGLRLGETCLGALLGEVVREKECRVIGSGWVWGSGLGTGSLTR